MSLHRARILWKREGDFLAGRYSRAHEIILDGARLTGSASTHIVPPPYAIEDAVDPEELFVAALSNCHMLWFLDLARQASVVIEAYDDEAEGELAKDAGGKLAITRVWLRPKIESAAEAATLAHLHHQAHEHCFLARAVKCEIIVEPR